jgi:stage II sporulation protein D
MVMSSSPPLATHVRNWIGRLLRAALAVSVLGTFAVLTTMPARADSVVSPKAGRFTIHGAGWGHGWGMSQYGAYGAARKGLSWKQILAFYYRGTQLKTMPSGTKIKIWITSDNDNSLRVLPATGLTVRDTAGHRYLLPTGVSYTSWRITRAGAGYRLSYRTKSGSHVTKSTGLTTGTWSFSTRSKIVKVVLPNGSVRSYRGSVALIKRGSGGRTINNALLEDYVKGVVPAEMPTSWAADAVRAQAVAARSYAVRLRDFGNYSGFDICDTTACQVYGGVGRETAAGNAAVKATAGKIVTYRGKVALTQFASSNGGYSAQGDYPYLAAHRDPYDGVIKSQAWRRTISASSIRRAWPSVGSVKQLQISSRDGAGAWGGRVKTIKIIGSARTTSVSGTTFQHMFGMRSSLYTIAGSKTSSPAKVTVTPAAYRPSEAYATFPRRYQSGSAVDLLLVSSTGALQRYPAVKGHLQKPVTIAAQVVPYTHVVNAGDWNGDGYQDVLVRTLSEKIYLWRGTRTGQLAKGVSMGFGRNIRAITSIGDANADGHPDLAVITRAGNLWLYYGDGKLGRASRKLISSGWQDHSWLRGPGDFNGDGRPDLISLVGDHLLLHKGMKGGLATPVTLATGWSDISSITSVGDFDSDHRADVIARTKDGRLMLYKGNGRATLTRSTTLAGSFAGTRFAV